MKRVLIALVVLLAIALAAYAALVLPKAPRTDRAWLPEQAKTATATVTDDDITLHNVRDWTYNADGAIEEVWRDVTVDPDEIVGVWFLIEPFATWDAVGHTFLSFEFADGSVYSFSVEARREQGEDYSAIRGAFRAYELSYQWGTERDFVTRRLIYLAHPLRLYPLSLEEDAGSALFKSLVAETNTLAHTPRFYHTLAANCTNILAKIVNQYYPDTLPFDASWYMTGYADLYLMREGLIKETGSIKETQAAHDLTRHKADITAVATSSPETFSRTLRELLK